MAGRPPRPGGPLARRSTRRRGGRPGTGRLAELFTADVPYTPSPWADAARGLDELALFWDAERDGADEAFTMTSEVLAVDADTAVVRVAVAYDRRAPTRPWRDLWVLRFAAGGRCAVVRGVALRARRRRRALRDSADAAGQVMVEHPLERHAGPLARCRGRR